MKKSVLLLSILIIGCFLTACAVLPYVASVLEPKPDTSTKRAWLNILEKDNDKQLLTEEEKYKASKSICALKNLEEGREVKVYIENSKKFCNVSKNDKVYFYREHPTDGSIEINLYYLLVQNSEPISLVPIEFRYSKELRRSIPIVDRLH
ncbi:MAG: hypothetical protein DSZ06_01385 [Sulfurospirillum sp.]|nr:MAG: hypothetical protein DSZ06_01385 [Sulfurospirillum sp.]